MSAAGLGAVLAVSLLGSLHCVAMCGPLVALHHGSGAARGDRRRKIALHQLGRATGYAGLGALAGGVGGLIDVAGAALAVQRAAMLLSAAALALWAGALATSALRSARRRRSAERSEQTSGRADHRAPSSSRAAASAHLFQRGLVQLRARPPARRAFGLGLLHAILPCGWLWAFVALAAGTGSPLLGATTMLVFWLGGLPALLGVAVLAAPLLARLRPRWPLVTAALVLGLAGAALLLRLPLISPDSAAPGAAPACHSSAALEVAP